ncbi:hypothetical protein SAMN05880501_106240 [Ureibacillus xyleni]|uniref:Nucleotide kinase n=1 Tax=Ureibacillus xyleni TaxID=614648 RepID=A0A285STC0_9BACL|nr:nucleotide kinase [Ureibacillus xyleni]SOC11650.1 hypothetical protein SAMN05880501_106240 [Ureibacillus xyleni]
MNGQVTYFYGRALTGQGVKHLYTDIINNEAKMVYLLQGSSGFKVPELLKELGAHYSKQGADVEYFLDPLFENTYEALFVKEPHHTLFLQGISFPNDLNITYPRIKVIPLNECVDVQKFLDNGELLLQLNQTKENYHNKSFEALANAISIHDDWEVETRRYMDWNGLNQQTDELFKDLFGSAFQLKKGKRTHRLLGTLTPEGARDTLQSITKNLERRLFIKGYPGTGKSSMMKKLANEAEAKGYDVQLVWCGLDSNSIDMVIIPELKFCIFDSTEPHVYYPDENRPGDEIFDIAKHCHPTEVEEKNISDIVIKYKSAISDAIRYAKLYAEAERKIREIHDSAIDVKEFEKRTAGLFI